MASPMLTQDDFNALAAQGHNRIPLVVQALADLDTPLSLYLKLTGGGRHTFLLESVEGGERFGRYSFVGLPARTRLQATGQKVEVFTDDQLVETYHGNPLDFIATYQQRFKVAVPQGLPRFIGGLRATSATTRCVSSSRDWPEPPSRRAWARPTSCCCSAKSWP